MQQIKSEFKTQSLLTTNLLTETGGVNSGLKAITSEISLLKKSAKTIQHNTEKVLQKLDEIEKAGKLNFELLQKIIATKTDQICPNTDLDSVNTTETNLQKKAPVQTKPSQHPRTRTTRIRKPLQQEQVNRKVDIKKIKKNKNLKLQNTNSSFSDKQKRILIPLDFLNI